MNFGRYQTIKEVGRGSMGMVYEAHDPQIDRIVAVKVLRKDRMDTESSVKRFHKEAKVIGRLSHPHIVTIYDVGEEQGTIYIAMEFLTGRSLDELVKENPLPMEEVVKYGIQIAETLDYAHQMGVVHRDIKPSNIVVHTNGWIKITDFGIAHIDDSSATLQTQAGDILGTPSYMSPEQVLGKPIDGRCDIFSLGAILYELSTGKRPFGGKGKNLATVFNEIINFTPEDPFIEPLPIPQKLSGIIMKALQKEPEKRFQTGSELAEALKECLKESKPPTAIIPHIEKTKRSGSLLIAIAVTSIVVCGFYWYLQSKSQSSLSAEKTAAAVSRESKLNSPAPLPEKANLEPKKTAQQPLEHTQKPAPPPAAAKPRSKQVQMQTPKKLKALPVKSQHAPDIASLMVRSNPQGAGVYVDGNKKGTAPLTLVLPTGKHKLRVTLSGYRDMEKLITLEETMEYPLSFNLKSVAETE